MTINNYSTTFTTNQISYKKNLQKKINDLIINLSNDINNIYGIIEYILIEYEKSKKTKKIDKYIIDELYQYKNIFLIDIENIVSIKNNLINYAKIKYGSGWFKKSVNKRSIYTAKNGLYEDINELQYIIDNNLKSNPNYLDYNDYLNDLLLYSEYVKISLENFIKILTNKLDKYKIKQRNLDSMVLSNINKTRK